jgi:hypothetical protein
MGSRDSSTGTPYSSTRRCLKNRVWPVPASVIKSSALLVAGGGATIPVHCPPSRVSCLGALSIEAVVRSGRLFPPSAVRSRLARAAASRRQRPRPVLLGSATFRIRPGTTAAVRIRLTRAGQALVRRYPSGAVLVAISSPGRSGHTKTTAITLRIARARHRRG